MTESRPGEPALRIPRIAPVAAGVERPLWSVMIPTFNCARYLRQTLESVLAQDPGPSHMQIEVVDDASTEDDPAAVVRDIGRGRVAFHRKTRNAGPTANFNTCVERSTGRLVHILHGDDLISVGYYDTIGELAERHPGLGLYATRCFFADEKLAVLATTDHIRELENPGRSPEPFFYATPIQCAGITVRRSSYEALGGFRPDLVHTADCEMWARVVTARGGVISGEIKATYRIFAANDSGRLAKTADNVRDTCRLNAIFAERYPGFSAQSGRARVSDMAWHQYVKFKLAGEKQAAENNHRLWVELTPMRTRLWRILKSEILPWFRRIRASFRGIVSDEA